MKILLVLFSLISCRLMSQEFTKTLIPFPANAIFTDETFQITKEFSIAIHGNSNDRIYPVATRMLQRLKNRTGIFIRQNSVTRQNYNAPGTFLLDINRPGILKQNEDESYILQIKNNEIRITAETDLGAIHALETLLQLIQNKDGYYYFPGCLIKDQPRFSWRGLLVDVSRHFIPLEVIKRNLDGMAALKMNVLHLHLTDDQGFRIESKTFPELHQLGSDGQYFTQEQIKEIITYAGERGIRVIPEFDIPGHASSWLVSHPEIGSGESPYFIENRFGVFNPSMNPASEKTYQFLENFFSEMALLFPDEYMHIGGDENNGKEWDANVEIQTFKKDSLLENNHQLQAYFNRKIYTILTKNGKKMIGWDEILQPSLPKNLVIQSWRGKHSILEATRNGFPVILSNGFYIDLMQPAENYYLNDPCPPSLPLSEEQKKLILGGEATMWSEMVTQETIDSRIWPRTAAIAERLWSSSSIINLPDMYDKLNFISIQLEEFGLTHEKNYEMMMRRLIGNEHIEHLKTLIDVLEPVKNYERVNSREVTFTTGSPFTRIVDVARSDAKVARKFNQLVDQYLINPGDKALFTQLKELLNLWSGNHEKLKKQILEAPVLNEIEIQSHQLSTIANIGLEALAGIEKNKKLTTRWKEDSLAILKIAKEAHAQTEIMVVSGIEQLTNNVKL